MGKKEHPGKRHVGRWILATLALAVIGVAVAGYFYFDVASWQRLDPVRLQSLAQTGSIFDKDGQFVTRLDGKREQDPGGPGGLARSCGKRLPGGGGLAVLQASRF